MHFTLIFDRTIQINDIISENKVHETVSAHVIDQKLVVEKNWISIMLITSMRVNFPDDL